MSPIHEETSAIWNRCEIVPSGCWLWKGARTNCGYGVTTRAKKSIYVHRRMFSNMVGPINAGHDIHHKCGVKRCCNPVHLESLPRKAHLMISGSFSAINAQKEFCDRGHPLSGTNLRLYTRRNGVTERVCRECKRERELNVNFAAKREYRKRWREINREKIKAQNHAYYLLKKEAK